MDRPDMGAGSRGRAPLSLPPGRFEDDRSDWLAHAPTIPMYLPRFEPAPDPRPETEPLPDDIFARMVDRSKRRRSRRWLAPLAGSVAAAILVGLAFFQFRGGPAPQSVASSTPAEMIVVPAATPGTAVAQCPAQRVGDRIQGNGAGGVDSGPAAIFAFQHAYYVARSGTLARTLVAPNASVSAAPAIQQGIDSIPVGTNYCVSLTPGVSEGQYVVVVTEYRPGTAAFTYNPQTVATARVGDKTLITGISPAG
ncbi:hypothetical protein [Nocardia arizonensis]|uniref:hypothetical protein n=1 Tax=Nocardia arizonensis TaxID=1141647 RepID=UPI0006D22E33|nr:hypothetical protein [Nocardia arizonensis]